MEYPVLIAEDDDDTSRLLQRYLEKDGFATLTAGNGLQALNIARHRPLGFVVLDLMLPGMQGWDVCEEIRAQSDVPILILSAKQEESDRLLGLSLGADDYVVKPFSPREVVARVHAILRRSRLRLDDRTATLQHHDLRLDPSGYTVSLKGHRIKLTTSEFALLHALMVRPEKVYSRSELLSALGSADGCVVDRVVDVHIASIRQKLNRVTGERQYVHTVRGIGYRLAEL